MDFIPKIIVSQGNFVFISVYRVLQPLNEQTSNGLMPMRNKMKSIYRSSWRFNPLQSKGFSRGFSNTTIQNHQFFGAQQMVTAENVKTFSPNYVGVKHGLTATGPVMCPICLDGCVESLPRAFPNPLSTVLHHALCPKRIWYWFFPVCLSDLAYVYPRVVPNLS